MTPQGKYLYDFIISKHKSGYFLDCEKENIEDLCKQLNIYKLRSKVEILNLSNEFVVAALSREKYLKIARRPYIRIRGGLKMAYFEPKTSRKL